MLTMPVVVGIAVCFNVAAQLCLRSGMMSIDTSSIGLSTLLTVATSGYIIAGLMLYGSSFTLYLYILSKYEVSYIAPINMSLVFVLLLFFSTMFLQESFTAKKAIGTLVVVGGIWIMSY